MVRGENISFGRETRAILPSLPARDRSAEGDSPLDGGGG